MLLCSVSSCVQLKEQCRYLTTTTTTTVIITIIIIIIIIITIIDRYLMFHAQSAAEGPVRVKQNVFLPQVKF